MKLRYIIGFIISLTSSTFLFGQQTKLDKANLYYSSFSFTKSINLYESLIASGSKSAEIYEKLGNSYYAQSNYELAKNSYDLLFDLTESISVDTYYKFISVLRSQQEYKRAEMLYTKMITVYPEEKREKEVFSVTPSILTSDSIKITISDANSKYSDFKASYLGKDNVVFTSSRDTKKLFSKKSTWNNDSYTELYKTNINDNGSLGAPVKLKGGVNKFYNESSAVFTADGLTMYFTRNNYIASRVSTDSLGNMLSKIYKAKFDGKKWGDIEELPFNSNEFNCAHPALSPEEDYLYFSSDMPGSLGESDIYRVSIKDSDFGQPENLGSNINTKGRDTFPFVSSDGILVFSSDYRDGLGGLDLYYVDLNSTSKRIYSFSDPINSPSDDFGLIYKKDQGTGFLTSNRKEGGIGSDDIYQFEGLVLPKTQDVTLVFQTNKGTPLLGTTSIILNRVNGTSLKSIVGKNNKLTLLDVDTTKDYAFGVSNTNYESLSTRIGYKGKDIITITLSEKAPQPLGDIPSGYSSKGSGINIKLDIIYFDYDSPKITNASASKLEKVAAIMKQYPSLEIEIVGHTDSTGSVSYNQLLSERRANFTKKWLIDNGISSNRMTTKGLGESTLMNGCNAKSKCTEQQHNQNRRVEFIIN